MMSKTVTIIGSYAVAFFLSGEELPQRGETVVGDRFFEGPGGKGSNQAVAASMFGADTRIIARVGLDRYGEEALAMYRRFGIDVTYIQIDPTIHTGMGVVLIDSHGNNKISVVLGANARLSPRDIDSTQEALKDSFIVGFQLENDRKMVEYAIRRVHDWGVLTFLDPAPAAPLPEDLYPAIDYIKPNETEATTLTGIPVTGIASAEDAGRWFIEKGVGTAIVTLGEHGAVLVTLDKITHLYPPLVKAVDTTGAGDIFAGAFMTALAGDRPIEEAIGFANHAASLSVMRPGVIDAIPTLEEIEASMALKLVKMAT